jgi:hypothetical protein
MQNHSTNSESSFLSMRMSVAYGQTSGLRSIWSHFSSLPSTRWLRLLEEDCSVVPTHTCCIPTRSCMDRLVFTSGPISYPWPLSQHHILLDIHWSAGVARTQDQVTPRPHEYWKWPLQRSDPDRTARPAQSFPHGRPLIIIHLIGLAPAGWLAAP